MDVIKYLVKDEAETLLITHIKLHDTWLQILIDTSMNCKLSCFAFGY